MRAAKAVKEPEILDTEEVDTEDDAKTDNWVQEKKPSEISRAQLEDEVLRKLWELKQENSEKPKWEQISNQSQTLKSYWSQWGRVKLENGVLYRTWISSTKGEIQQII